MAKGHTSARIDKRNQQIIDNVLPHTWGLVNVCRLRLRLQPLSVVCRKAVLLASPTSDMTRSPNGSEVAAIIE